MEAAADSKSAGLNPVRVRVPLCLLWFDNTPHLHRKTLMTKLLLTVLAVGLSGCIVSAPPIESSDTPSNNDTSSDHVYEGKHGPKGWNDCVPYIVKVVIDNTTWFVELPSLCDPIPYIFKGDPGPDMWERCNNPDPVWQDRVIQAALVVAEREQ